MVRERRIVQLLTLSLHSQSLDAGGKTGCPVDDPRRPSCARHGVTLNCYFCKGLHSFVSAASKPAASTSYEISPDLLEAVN